MHAPQRHETQCEYTNQHSFRHDSQEPCGHRTWCAPREQEQDDEEPEAKSSNDERASKRRHAFRMPARVGRRAGTVKRVNRLSGVRVANGLVEVVVQAGRVWPVHVDDRCTRSRTDDRAARTVSLLAKAIGAFTSVPVNTSVAHGADRVREAFLMRIQSVPSPVRQTCLVRKITLSVTALSVTIHVGRSAEGAIGHNAATMHPAPAHAIDSGGSDALNCVLSPTTRPKRIP